MILNLRVPAFDVCSCREKIVVPVDKPFITLSGTQASKTIITWSDGGDIFESPTLTVLASDFVARLLTIEVFSYHYLWKCRSIKILDNLLNV